MGKELIDFIPESMKSINNWVLWKKEEVKGKTTKIPYKVTGDGKASSIDSGTWSDYKTARSALEANRDRFDGVGFMLNDSGLTFIDVDHCLKDGEYCDDRAKDIIQTIGADVAFVEVSQSGEGLHIFVRGQIAKSFKNPKNGVEMYSEKRYCAITGKAISPREPSENERGLLSVYNKYKTQTAERVEGVRREGVSVLDDKVIIERCRKSVKGQEFSDLYEGNFSKYNSHSEADLRLCGFFAFWTDRDPDQIDRLFRTSGLYREKWERKDYRERTIFSACAGCEESISEYIDRKEREERSEYEQCFSRL